jgi:hypothetical protein
MNNTEIDEMVKGYDPLYKQFEEEIEELIKSHDETCEQFAEEISRLNNGLNNLPSEQQNYTGKSLYLHSQRSKDDMALNSIRNRVILDLLYKLRYEYKDEAYIYEEAIGNKE